MGKLLTINNGSAFATSFSRVFDITFLVIASPHSLRRKINLIQSLFSKQSNQSSWILTNNTDPLHPSSISQVIARIEQEADKYTKLNCLLSNSKHIRGTYTEISERQRQHIK